MHDLVVTSGLFYMDAYRDSLHTYILSTQRLIKVMLLSLKTSLKYLLSETNINLLPIL